MAVSLNSLHAEMVRGPDNEVAVVNLECRHFSLDLVVVLVLFRKLQISINVFPLMSVKQDLASINEVASRSKYGYFTSATPLPQHEHEIMASGVAPAMGYKALR